jgi:hypothetical protein
MKLLWLGLVVMLASTNIAVAQSAPIETEEFHAWLKERMKKAKAGERELVRVPVVSRAENWGCECPFTFIGSSTMDFAGGAWVNMKYLPGVAQIPYRSEGIIRVVEGYFTGEVTIFTDDFGESTTEYVLTVMRERPFYEDNWIDTDAEVILRGAEAKKEITKRTDDKPWMILVNSIPLMDKKLEKKKTDALKKLTDAGFNDAEVIDSRETSALNCCYAAVVAGRYATEAEAKTALKDVKKKFKGAYIKKGW